MLTKRTYTLSQTLFFAFIMLLTTAACAQKPSPAATATGTVGGKTITISYSQPAVKGRTIFGGLVPYGQVWRTGANETTTIEFSDDVMVEGKPVAKGKYGLFSIPGEKEWTIIINKGIKWGAYTYKQDEDVLRVNVPAGKRADVAERFTISVMPSGIVSLHWADMGTQFKVQ